MVTCSDTYDFVHKRSDNLTYWAVLKGVTGKWEVGPKNCWEVGLVGLFGDRIGGWWDW